MYKKIKVKTLYLNSLMQHQYGHKKNIAKMHKNVALIIFYMIQQLYTFLKLNGPNLQHLWNNFGR